jgi:hypothetical protein
MSYPRLPPVCIRPGEIARSVAQAEPEWRELWNRLVFCAPVNEKTGLPNDIVSRYPGVLPANGATWTDGPFGRGIKGGTSAGFRFDFPANVVPGYPFTFLVVGMSDIGWSTYLGIGNKASPSSNAVSIAMNPSNFMALHRAGSGESLGAVSYSNQSNVVIARMRSATERLLYVNGVLDVTDTTSYTPSAFDRIGIAGNLEESSGYMTYGALFAIFKGDLPPAMVRRLVADPFGFLKRKAKRYFVPVAGLTVEQEGFRAYNDDGDEDASTAYAAQDADFAKSKDANLRVRFLLNMTGDVGAKKFRLKYRKQGGTGWRPVAQRI